MKRSPLKRKPKKGRPKLPSKKATDKKLDTMWSKKVKEKAGHKCEHCAGTKNLNSHHIFSRRHWGLRWDLDNGICLCSSHHWFDVRFSAHQTPTKFSDWVKTKRGLEWYAKLEFKSNQIIKKSSLDIEAIMEMLQGGEK